MPRACRLASLLLAAACDGSKVTSDEEAEMAAVGLDRAVERVLDLGLRGYGLADSANIDPQSEPGEVSGTMTVGGQVDQGSSDNKGLLLGVTLVDYADRVDLDPEDDEEAPVEVTYDTEPGAEPYADLKLRDLPEGTMDGTLTGKVWLEGDLDGEVTLALTIDAALTSDGADGVSRVEGATRVTGTVTNDDGDTYTVDLTL